MGLGSVKHSYEKMERRLHLYWGKPRMIFDPNGFPHTAWKARRKIALQWLTHPSEFFASVLFLFFILLSFLIALLGRPEAWASLYYAVVYGGLWFFWMAYVIYFLPAGARYMQFLRGFGPWVAVMVSYNWMRYLIPALDPNRFDLFLRQSEIRLWGHTCSLWVKPLWGNPHWADVFCLLYLGLFIWLFLFLFYYAFYRQVFYQSLMLGLMMIYIGGFLGYLVCPAVGPRYAFPAEWTWLCGGPFYRLTNAMVAHMGAKLDVFPSLHAAISIFLFMWLARYHRRHMIWGIPLALGIWVSTIYLGYHYFPDLAMGWLLGIGVFFMAPALVAQFDRMKEKLGRER